MKMVSYLLPKPRLPFLARAREASRLAYAFMKGDRPTINDITAATQFSPLQPISPGVPEITGRLYDYQSGINVQYIPRGYGSNRIQFGALRAFSRNCEIARICLEKVKDQITAFDWSFAPKEDSNAQPDDPRIGVLTDFFQKPDKIHHWDIWLRMLLEDFLAVDALTIYRPKDRAGRPYSFEIFDGGTIKPLIDANGRRPLAPDPAFSQIIKGSPRALYTTDEMLYMPRNLFPDDPTYGFSTIEQCLLTIKTSMERQQYQLAYFTQGSMPDGYIEMPVGMTPMQVEAFEEMFNDILAGNATQRRKMPFLPAGAKPGQLKEPDLKNDFDEWIARIICFNLGLPPTAFVKQMNRSSSDNDQERSEQEGQLPKMKFVKLVVDSLIGDFGPDFARDLEFVWKDSKNQDPQEQAEVETTYAKSAVKSINEVRAELGLDPDPNPLANQLLAYTPTGYVPLDAFQQQQEQQQANLDAQAAAAEERAKNPQPAAGANGAAASSNHTHDDNAKVYGRVAKAVRHKAIPFVVPQLPAPKPD